MKWTIEEGLTLIRGLQPQAKTFGYHIALGGGVLNKGVSEKDLDLYFLPMDNSKDYPIRQDQLVTFLNEVWGYGVPLGDYGRDDALTRALYNAVPPPAAYNMNEVVQANADYVDEFIENALFNGAMSYDVETSLKPKPKEPVSSYKKKLKFTRSGGDRIDVFIL